MIEKYTKLFVADNSGSKVARCIGVLKGRVAGVGDIIKVSICSIKKSCEVKKGDVFFAIVVRTVRKIFRKNGEIVSFSENACVILNEKLEMKFTRIFGPVAKEVKDKKIISLACEVV